MGQIAFIIWLADVYTMPVNMGQIAFIIWLADVYTMVGRHIHNACKLLYLYNWSH